MGRRHVKRLLVMLLWFTYISNYPVGGKNNSIESCLSLSEISRMCRCPLFHMLWWASTESSAAARSYAMWHPETWANKRHALTTWLACGHGVLVLWGRIVSTESQSVWDANGTLQRGLMLVRWLGHLCCFVFPQKTESKTSECESTPRSTLSTNFWICFFLFCF